MLKNPLVLVHASRFTLASVVLSKLAPPPPTNTATSLSNTSNSSLGCKTHFTMSHDASVAVAAEAPSRSSTGSSGGSHHTQKPMRASDRAKEEDSTAVPQPKVFFPLGYKEAAQQWWTSVTAPVAENNVLSYIPFIKPATSLAESGSDSSSDHTTTDPHGNRIWQSSLVPLSGKNRALNEFSVERVGEKTDDTLVMLHGYGAGLGFFYKNFEPLSRAPGWKLYALDMLGMGNSSRPSFSVKAKDQEGKIREAEDWFVDSLEEWRRIRKIDRFTLLGHSLGGYLAVSYALKYPGRVNKLILASPVGIPEDPYAVSAEMPEPNDSTIAAEFTQEQESIVAGSAPPPPSDQNNFMHQRAASAAAGTPEKPPRRPLSKWISWLWDANVSPFSIVRMTGPLGPRFVSGWTSRRFNHLPADESQALHTYSYSLFRQRGSGEYALPYLLAPGAFARSPIINRIQNVGRGVIKSDTGSKVRETGIPIVMMYGDHDWMDVAGGYASEQKIKDRVLKALTTAPPEERSRENGSARVVITKNAGHHLYIDNPDDFNKVVIEEMAATRQQGLRERQ